MTVHYRTFLPHKNPQNRNEFLPNLSVCVISLDDGSLLDEQEIWNIGFTVGSISGYTQPVEARADISVANISKCQLIVEVDSNPFKEHANIKPFPSDPLRCQRLATELAMNSELRIMSNIPT